MTYAYLSFKNAEDRNIAIKKKFTIRQGKTDKGLFISNPTAQRNICNNCGNPNHIRAGYPGLATVKPKASQQQVAASTVFATMTHWSSSLLLEQLVFPTYNKIAREVDEILAAQILRHQSDIDMLTDQLTNTGTTQTPEDHADLLDLDMEMDRLHQSTSLTADPPPPFSETSNTSWKLVLTKNQKKKLKKQEKRAEKAKFLQEVTSLNSLTASPDSTLDSHKPILSQPPPHTFADAKRSDKSDDKIITLIMKKRKNESSTGDNNIIITGYQPEENDKNFTLNLVVYDIPAKWTNYQLLSELNKWRKVVFVSTRVQKKYQTAKKFQAAITNIPEDMTIESLFPEGTSSSFINENNLQSFKIVREQDGSRILIGYFATWDALSRRRQPKALGSGSKSSSFKKAGSSLMITRSNRTPLGSHKLQINNKYENNTNSSNLAQSQNSSGRSTSFNTTKGSLVNEPGRCAAPTPLKLKKKKKVKNAWKEKSKSIAQNTKKSYAQIVAGKPKTTHQQNNNSKNVNNGKTPNVNNNNLNSFNNKAKEMTKQNTIHAPHLSTKNHLMKKSQNDSQVSQAQQQYLNSLVDKLVKQLENGK
ncbi:hypothetical protein RclHR1_12910008 [Rhizophagus clarus]|uniref:Uncharacterized protein n=1 Tax=Rhizophagus clarus TaxID=94130 RepID=A0A2Z6R0W9_9GLOM|nr:hypothetical protein RclHR1_12910008 [Rhizophagus clarus]